MKKTASSAQKPRGGGGGWFLLNYKKVSPGTRDLKWKSLIVLQSHHQPGFALSDK